MLDTKSLFFNRSDLFDDLFEGTFPKPTWESIQHDPTLPDNVKLSMVNSFGMIQKYWPRGYFLNCWHVNDFESAAMWKLYTSNNQSVAIQSTFKKLTQNITDKTTVYASLVKYIDYDKELIPMDNVMQPYVHKRISFEHELRVLISDLPKNLTPQSFEQIKNVGKNIEVDLNMLIENVYVAPSAPLWFKELAKSVTKKYDLPKNVIDSKLDERPLFR